MKISMEAHDRTTGFLFFKKPYFELIVQFQMTEDEFLDYKNIKSEVHIPENFYTGEINLKKSHFRSSTSIESSYDEYSRKNLNPTVHFMVRRAKKGKPIKFKCRTRNELELLRSSLGLGAKWFKDLLNTNPYDGERKEVNL